MQSDPESHLDTSREFRVNLEGEGHELMILLSDFINMQKSNWNERVEVVGCSCSGNGLSTMETVFLDSPDYLIITLNRFEGRWIRNKVVTKKINKDVEVDQNFDVAMGN